MSITTWLYSRWLDLRSHFVTYRWGGRDEQP